jgi:hypothetical protein
MHASGEHVRKGPQAVDFRSALQFYLIDCTTLPGKLIDILIVFLNMVVCAILVVKTYPVAPFRRRKMGDHPDDPVRYYSDPLANQPHCQGMDPHRPQAGYRLPPMRPAVP